MLGLAIGLMGSCFGGRMRVKDGVVEFYGGWAEWLIDHFPGGPFAACTLGHTILGRTAAALDLTRAHEHIHVRQYERWGPLFLPLYAGSSLLAWLGGRRPYRDNRFEREAYRETGES